MKTNSFEAPIEQDAILSSSPSNPPKLQKRPITLTIKRDRSPAGEREKTPASPPELSRTNSGGAPKWLPKVRKRRSPTSSKGAEGILRAESSSGSNLAKSPSDVSFFQSLEEIILNSLPHNGPTPQQITNLHRTILFFASPEEISRALRRLSQQFPESQGGLLDFVLEWVLGDTESSLQFVRCQESTEILEKWISELGDLEQRKGERLRRAIKESRSPKKGKESVKIETDSAENSLPLVPMRALKWAGYNEEWLAATITLHEHSLLSSIPLSDFINHVQKGRKEGALFNSIKYFNCLSHWVTISIVKEAHLKTRIEYLSKIIRICDHLLQLNNFSSAMAILSGLNHFSVSRMKQTWKGVDPEITEKYNNIEATLSYNHNYSVYRQALKQCTGPCVPYLGLFLSDLTFIENGNPGRFEEKINYTKWQMIGEQLEAISLRQNDPFVSLEETPKLLLFIPALNAFDSIDDDECEWYSKFMEPVDHEDAIEDLVKEMMEIKKQNEVLKQKLNMFSEINF